MLIFPPRCIALLKQPPRLRPVAFVLPFTTTFLYSILLLFDVEFLVLTFPALLIEFSFVIPLLPSAFVYPARNFTESPLPLLPFWPLQQQSSLPDVSFLRPTLKLLSPFIFRYVFFPFPAFLLVLFYEFQLLVLLEVFKFLLAFFLPILSVFLPPLPPSSLVYEASHTSTNCVFLLT